MAEPRTRPTTASVAAFLAKVRNAGMREDCAALVTLMSAVTKAPPVMWGTNIVGFGSYPYRYDRGRALDWPLTGFAPRAKQLVLYVMPGCDGYDGMVAALGPVTCGVSCIYVKRLADLDQRALRTLLKASVAHLSKTHGAAQ